jgi:hypothetical protein
MPRVYISDKLEDAGLEILKASGVEIDNRPGLKGDELKAAIRAAEGVVVRSGTRITAELLEDPGKLKAIVRGGVGVDNIDVEAALKRGITVTNTPGVLTEDTADMTMALILAVPRRLQEGIAGKGDKPHPVPLEEVQKILRDQFCTTKPSRSRVSRKHAARGVDGNNDIPPFLLRLSFDNPIARLSKGNKPKTNGKNKQEGT